MNDTANHLEILCELQRMLNLHLQESKDKKYAIELNACAIKRKS